MVRSIDLIAVPVLCATGQTALFGLACDDLGVERVETCRRPARPDPMRGRAT